MIARRAMQANAMYDTERETHARDDDNTKVADAHKNNKLRQEAKRDGYQRRPKATKIGMDAENKQ